MFGFLTRKRANRAMIDAVYGAMVDRARDPVLFTDFAITDNFEGRFEALTLYAVLTTRRLKAMPAPAPDLAQDLIDHVFIQFDRALRDMGVGDITVPKRMKTMASAFLGRASAYDQTLQSGDLAGLGEALLRNVYGSDVSKRDFASKLAELSQSFDRALAEMTMVTLAEAIMSAPPARSFTKASS